jgi:predicted metalloprotease with PDZ domain
VKYLFVLLSVCILAHKSQGQVPTLSYQLAYDTTTAVLTVQLKMTGTDSGKTYLQLPTAFANQDQLYKAVSSLSVMSGNASLDTTSEPSVRLLTHKPNAKLHLTYQLKQDWKGQIIHPKTYRAVLQPTYFHLTGYALFVYPKIAPESTLTLSLNWAGLPKGWAVGNSLHILSRTYTTKIQRKDLENSIFTAGDFRSQSLQVNGKPVYVFTRGNKWKFTDAELATKIQEIISIERQFWKDHSQPYYFVSLIPYEGEGTYNGSSLHQSFMLGMTQDFTMDVSILRLLAHEYFHRWTGGEIEFTGEEGDSKWFSEGFTEYYAYKLLYQSGLISLSNYIAKANRIIADYYLSPVRNEDRKALSKNYWSTRDYHLLPYNKGFVYALHINHEIQSGSNGKYSLDNVMFDLAKAAKHKQLINDSLFLERVAYYAGKKIDTSHIAYIDNGQLIPVAANSISTKALGSFKQLGAFEIGFDLDASWKAKQIQDVKENSEAWKAGIRNGQKIKGYSISYDEVNKPAEISIEENGSVKKIIYFPMSATKTDVPQFSIN